MDNTQQNHVTIISHYVHNWDIQSAILQTKVMPKQHSAENIANVLPTATERWQINGKVAASVHDNATC